MNTSTQRLRYEIRFAIASRWVKTFFLVLATVGCGTFVVLSEVASAQESPAADGQSPKPRRFNDVLDDLLNEFSYDLKTGQVQGIRNLSLRRIAVSDNIPKSYEGYLENLVAERVRRHSSIRVLQCTGCRVKRTVVENNRVVITTPVNNTAELDKLASQLGIEAWLDVALLYQETSMILAFNAFDAKTKELLWAKTYNSESLEKRTVDPVTLKPVNEPGKEQDGAEKGARYVVGVTAGWHLVPNVKKTSNMLGLNLRLAESFNRGRSEVGALVAAVLDPSLFIQNYDGVEGDPSATGEVTVGNAKETIKPFKAGLSLYATYHHNFGPESADEGTGFRPFMHLGLGGLFAKGFITAGARTGGGLRFGRHFLLEVGLSYAAPTDLKIKDKFIYRTQGGLGGDVTFGLHF